MKTGILGTGVMEITDDDSEVKTSMLKNFYLFWPYTCTEIIFLKLCNNS